MFPQAEELEKWGIRTICINEETPNDKELSFSRFFGNHDAENK
jgi:hypothetical protein